ncbi:DUF6640 family protein [Oceanicoccus sagamiensis]|uniref:Uncharacterized protein n=1 Tax=Oceanicoccus sagamiensis TaxID=716816 RepID=A0A1X9N8Z5_9GAMM|nr:DUF6640 family protein [Oceanicoccus sagamiensis]ARN74548.1 hypothetical protein BST96_10700 [Oceanicoccus sagamiensis]
MEILYDQNLLPRMLLTITSIALAIGPAVADFNKTHATNPLWPPHARFHVVWQVITNSSLCFMMIYVLWTPLVEQYNLQLILVLMVQGAILAPLYITIASMGLFDGALKDVNGLRPFKFNIAGKIVELDTNVVGFSNITLVLIIAGLNIVSSVPVL